jgi:hypothetical protein
MLELFAASETSLLAGMNSLGKCSTEPNGWKLLRPKLGLLAAHPGAAQKPK